MDSAIKVLTATFREAGRGRMTGKVNRSQSVYLLRKGEERDGRGGEGRGEVDRGWKGLREEQHRGSVVGNRLLWRRLSKPA